MSSPASKSPAKTAAARVPREKSETLKSVNKISAQLSEKRAAEVKKRTKKIKNCHKDLQSIQHEYEQFEINMDERD